MSAPAPSTTPDRTLALVPESVRTRRTAVAFDAGVLLRITRMAFAHPWRMALGLGCTLLAAGAQLVIPQLIGDAVDFAQGLLASAGDDAAARAALARAAALILVTSVFRGLCTMMQNYQGEAVGQLIAYRLRLDLYAKVQSLSFSYHDRVHTGDLMTRGILDVEGTKLWVSTGVQRSLLLAVLVGGGAWLMMSIDVVLGASRSVSCPSWHSAPRSPGSGSAPCGMRSRRSWRCSPGSWRRTSAAFAWCAPSCPRRSRWPASTRSPAARSPSRTAASMSSSRAPRR